MLARAALGLVRLVAALAVLLLAAVALCGIALWSTLPPRHDHRRIAALGAAVAVSLDRDGVPHIRATSEADAATALGYLHARDRLFQMELMRRAASGRLSELAGPATLPLDRLFRTLGLARLAEADLPNLPADTRHLLDAYSAGVNAWIAERGRRAAPEFVALGAPAPWRPADCLLWGRTMGLWLSSNWRDELSRAALAGVVDADRLRELWPPQPGIAAPQADAPSGGVTRLAVHLAPHLATALLDALPGFPAPFTLPGEASDEWAVDGAHSTTGAPLLAGDPHLSLTFPAIWYLARIDTPDITLAGATAPGVPFLVIGRNRHIAWSFTTAPADTQDVFSETVLPDGRYATPEGPRAFTTRIERIAVRGHPDEILTVRSTRHGPVVSDLPAIAVAAPGTVLAAAMTNLLPGDAAPGLHALDRASTVADAGIAAALITAPVQNLLVADRAGIAMVTTGRVPLRRSGDGSAPVAGADGLHDWTGFAAGPDLPRTIAPAEGRLLNGNERSWPADFSPFMGRDIPADWRAQRMRSLLRAAPRHSLAAFARMQADATSAYAVDILPALLAAIPEDGSLAARAGALLRGWSGEMADNQPAPLVFNAWSQRFDRMLITRQAIPERDNAIPEDLPGWLLGPAPDSARRAWCGDTDCHALLAATLAAAAAALAARFGPDPAAWRWGDAHRAVFADQLLAELPVLGALTTATIAVPGDDTTLFRGGNPRLGHFEALHGAAYRGVYDLEDLDRSRFIIAPGQSGNPMSANAYDMMQRWAQGDTILLAAPSDRGRDTAPDRLPGSHPDATVELTP